ncbi:hydroxyethylthiazole kinase [bacterium]|nr:hydroxyethylthiazole kinase [bacterium]
MDLTEKVIAFRKRIIERSPLVHHITNYVVMNVTANVTLAMGASPVMAHAREEVAEMSALASALVINIGTLSRTWIEAMYLACEAARRKGIPIVVDPVGAGATKYRTEVSRHLLDCYVPSVVRGNSSEIRALIEEGSTTKGVDSIHTVDEVKSEAVNLAQTKKIVVAITGVEDFITDGEEHYCVRNGHELMARVTGTGCSATSVIAAFLAVTQDRSEYAIATAAGLAYYGLAAEYAARDHQAPGSFGIALLDWLYRLNDTHLREGIRLEQVQS